MRGKPYLVRGKAYILDRCQPVPYSGCWLWLLSAGSHGYGQGYDGVTICTAHSMSYRAFVGVIPAGMLVQHSCDERLCVNPDHLSLGTDATNAEDKRLKGRAAKKLSPKQRIEIRALYTKGGVSQRKLAAQFGVTQRAVWCVLHE